MAKPFIIPWTINDENEFSLPVLPWYFTNQELGVIILGTILSYLVCAPVLGTGLVNVAVMALNGLVLLQYLMRYKKGKPASWLWDLKLALGLLPESRALFRSTRAVRWLSLTHVARPSVYLAGAKRPGEDLSVNLPWLTRMAPGVEWPVLMVPRRRRRWQSVAIIAPQWHRPLDTWHQPVARMIPVSCRWVMEEPVLRPAPVAA